MAVLRWGLIGCGDIAARRVAPAIRELPGCRLAAVSRARSELAEEFARRFGADRWYADWRELLADPEVDAVYVATPPYLHMEQTVAAAGAGKHVLCEKPMALDAAQCRKMTAACRGSGVRLGVSYYRHFYPVVTRIKEIVTSGEIGRVVLAEMKAFESFRPEPSDPRYWLTRKSRAGGGPLMDFGCHRIEVLLNILGPVAAVRGSNANLVTDWEVEDTSLGLFEFESGARGLLSVSRAVEEPRDSLEIYGSAGSIHVPVLNRGRVIVYSPDGERQEEHPPHENVHLPCVRAAAEAFLEDRDPPVPGETGVSVAEISEQIYGP